MRVPPRRLTVLASLDVAGYTRLVEADERGTLSELAAVRLKIIRPTLAAHGGNLFKTMGDGALIGANAVVASDVPPGAVVRAPRPDVRLPGDAAAT